MRILKNGDAGIILLIVGIALAIGIWSVVGKWFPQSPQDVAEGRGITQGFLGVTNQDGSFVVIFDNESLGRKRILIWPTYVKEGIEFIEDNKNIVILFFEPMGIRGCEKLSDEELVRLYIQRVEVHY